MARQEIESYIEYLANGTGEPGCITNPAEARYAEKLLWMLLAKASGRRFYEPRKPRGMEAVREKVMELWEVNNEKEAMT